MPIKAAEKVIVETTINDVRGLSRMEIIGMVMCDLNEAQCHGCYDFIDMSEHRQYILEKLINDCIISCNFDNKSINILLGKDDSLMGEEEYSIEILPMGKKGIKVYYCYTDSYGSTSVDTTTWSIDQCMDNLNIDWKEN